MKTGCGVMLHILITVCMIGHSMGFITFDTFVADYLHRLRLAHQQVADPAQCSTGSPRKPIQHPDGRMARNSRTGRSAGRQFGPPRALGAGTSYPRHRRRGGQENARRQEKKSRTGRWRELPRMRPTKWRWRELPRTRGCAASCRG